MTEPRSSGRQRRSFTGDSGQMREKYTALWPEPEILAKLVSKDSLRRTPTSALAGEGAKQKQRSTRTATIPAVLIPSDGNPADALGEPVRVSLNMASASFPP